MKKYLFLMLLVIGSGCKKSCEITATRIMYEPIENLIDPVNKRDISFHRTKIIDQILWSVTIFPGDPVWDKDLRTAWKKALKDSDEKIAKLCGSR